jgi:transcriptional regulator GlxA family with amidase domain
VLRLIRLQQVRQLLIATDFTIDRIAFESGFVTAAYLSRCFKQSYGVSPSVWRTSVNKTSSGYYDVPGPA